MGIFYYTLWSYYFSWFLNKLSKTKHLANGIAATFLIHFVFCNVLIKIGALDMIRNLPTTQVPTPPQIALIRNIIGKTLGLKPELIHFYMCTYTYDTYNTQKWPRDSRDPTDLVTGGKNCSHRNTNTTRLFYLLTTAFPLFPFSFMCLFLCLE